MTYASAHMRSSIYVLLGLALLRCPNRWGDRPGLPARASWHPAPVAPGQAAGFSRAAGAATGGFPGPGGAEAWGEETTPMELPWADSRRQLTAPRPESPRARGYRGHHRRPGLIARAAAWPRWPGHLLYKHLEITWR